MLSKTFSTTFAGKELIADFNDLAENANGSVLLKYGNTVVLATATMAEEPKDGAGFFPLTVDYEEKFYAVGQILGSQFTRREGRPSEEAILSGRIIDRTIRPLFDQWIRNEVHVVVTVLSVDEQDPDILGIIAASLALGVSNIPWNGPVSSVRLGALSSMDSLVMNPPYVSRKDAVLDMVVCGKDGNINMIEVGANEASEDQISKAFKMASEEIEKIQKWQKEIIQSVGKEKTKIIKSEPSKVLIDLFQKEIIPQLDKAVFSGPGKDGIKKLGKIWKELLSQKIEAGEIAEDDCAEAGSIYEEAVNDLIHKEAIKNDRRPDGRKMEEVRPLFAKAGGISPIIHGSGIFYRGGTHIFSALTLAGPDASLTVDSIEGNPPKHFMHHYNFPPFSTGEPGRMGGMNRRMIGHGALAEKALRPIVPAREVFPYTIRVVSEALASNGSTSMGSVCASTIALMDAGVPIKDPVAGIASGLMMLSEKEYKLLTDIQGPEDEHGDMDFKVAGTRNGITAVQMDVKVGGIPLKILSEALDAAKRARLQILDVIEKEIPAPRSDISPNAPKILSLKIDPDDIGMVIGSGGKTIKAIQEQTGATIAIEDDGTVYFTGKNGSAEKAKDIVYGMTRKFSVGEKIEGEVTRLMDFGAFVKISSQTEGLVHISQMASFRVNKVSDLVKIGDIVPVIVKEIDEKGRYNLSIKDADPNFFKEKTV